MTYSISSDQHCHAWTQFGKPNADGVNSRLRIILDELKRQADTLIAAGGTEMFLGGDLLHVRGRIEPGVLNPLMDTFRDICSRGIKVYAIAGNHDLAGANADKLGNAMQALDDIPGFTAVTKPGIFGSVVMVPWVHDLDDLRAKLAKIAGGLNSKAGVENYDLIIHAPVNGVIKGIPDVCLDPGELAALGFRTVWSGHFHNHVDFGNGVYSIGATTHQTWSDVDTKAGFVMVYPDRVEHHESQAPRFMDYTSADQLMGGEIAGNYVRMRLQDEDEAVINERRAALETAGALGIVNHSSAKRVISRDTKTATSQTGASLEASVSSFVADHLQTTLDKAIVVKMALDVLATAKMGDITQ